MERGFEILTLPYMPAYHTWQEHLDGCAQCLKVELRATQGEMVPDSELCSIGEPLVHELEDAIFQQHILSVQN
jgi:hypothetical protein